MMLRSTQRAKSALVVWACAVALAQEQPAAAPPPPPLENLGKPMVLPFRCTEDDMQWAGLTCSETDPCPVYLEISAIESVGNRIFAAGNIHSAAVTLYSTLLASDDAGRTWREPHERIRGAGIDHIQFADPENGWASGQTLSPLLQDPFLLLTSDGGKTWRRQPVFNDTRMGSLQQFFFTGRSNGSLVFDAGPGSESGRYQLYESQDGGATWSIREESDKPPRLRRTADSPDWRSRADGASGAFEIERRAEGRWTPAAAFAVKIGGCKPE